MPNFKTITARITHEQYEALRADAARRSDIEGGLPDASRIIRELVQRWMEEARRRKPKK